MIALQRILLTALLAMALTTAAGAANSPIPLVRDVVQEGLKVIAQHQRAFRDNPAQARALVSRLLRPHTDLTRMAHYVAGSYWQQASEATQGRFTTAFANHLINSYAAGVSEYTDRIVDFARDGDISYRRLNSTRRTVVRATIDPSGGRNVDVDLYLHRVAGQWQVYDVRVVGVSILVAYRASLLPRLYMTGLDGVTEYLAKRAPVRSPSSQGSPRP